MSTSPSIISDTPTTSTCEDTSPVSTPIAKKRKATDVPAKKPTKTPRKATGTAISAWTDEQQEMVLQLGKEGRTNAEIAQSLFEAFGGSLRTADAVRKQRKRAAEDRAEWKEEDVRALRECIATYNPGKRENNIAESFKNKPGYQNFTIRAVVAKIKALEAE